MMRLDEKDEVLRPAIYGVFAVLAAMCGAVLCVLGWKLNVPVMALLGFIVVCAGIVGGVGSILWGWWKVFRKKSR